MKEQNKYSDKAKCIEEGCEKKVVHITGACLEHRAIKCRKLGCNHIISSATHYRFCSKHRMSKSAFNTEINGEV